MNTGAERSRLPCFASVASSGGSSGNPIERK